MTDFLTRPPFNLTPEDIAWVKATLASLTPAERVGQLFNLGSWGNDPTEQARLAALQPGGVTRFFGPDADYELGFLDGVRQGAKVPPLLSADLEGSRMSLSFGTEVPNPLALAAVDDEQASRQIARIMAEEAVALGLNWSFTPVLDINAAFRSPIVATRGFGSDTATIARHALAQAQVFQAHGIAATVKHFPGEGHDDRDQHLVTTINPLSVEAWEASHGALYRAAIEAGVLSVMSAHIAFPAFVRSLDPTAGLEAFRPASLSQVLNVELLRNRLGFNGVIVSDASEMAGLTSWCRAEDSKPDIIANGCDMILFTRTPEADMAAVAAAIDSGALPQARVMDALTRVLGLKAALGLHRKKVGDPASRKAAFGTEANRATARAVTARAPTLVKDVQGLLPLSPSRHRRVLVISGGIVSPIHREPLEFKLPQMLAAEGFEVTLHTPETAITRENFDLILYLFGEETLLTRGRIFLDWAKISGNFIGAMQRYWHDIPTAMISFGYPYYLYDAPRVPTYINAYATMDSMQAAVVECLLGRAEWNRTSPVDPFCGLEDARY
jgi:beta-N-acetylhexosaminidase